MNLQLLGAPQSADTQIMRGRPADGKFTTIYLRERKISGAVAINRGADISALRIMMDRALFLPPDQLSDTSISLRAMLKNNFEKVHNGMEIAERI